MFTKFLLHRGLEIGNESSFGEGSLECRANSLLLMNLRPIILESRPAHAILSNRIPGCEKPKYELTPISRA